MPPRIDLLASLRATQPSTSNCQRLFSASTSSSASTIAQRRRFQDPYALAQAKARKAANASRQEVLRTERSKALGDPVKGITTPFVESFDKALNLADNEVDTPASQSAKATRQERLNHFVSKQDLEASVQNSKELSLPRRSALVGKHYDVAKFEKEVEEHAKEHKIAEEALARITALENSSGKDKLHVNIQRCIDTFGRHNTDAYLAPKPSRETGIAEKTPRAGPDTGSSEVQVAILTAKIRALANFLETRGRKDHVNKRNLRLLVHRRQKLLRYLRRKERGGERWQNLIATLGLSEGTYRGEISL